MSAEETAKKIAAMKIVLRDMSFCDIAVLIVGLQDAVDGLTANNRLFAEKYRELLEDQANRFRQATEPCQDQ